MEINTEKFYVFYDGDCGFCNYWVQWILRRDQKDLFLFASLQSNFGQNFLKSRGLENKIFNTLILWSPEKYYLTKSEALLKIAKLLGGKYQILASMNILPLFLTNFFYDKISKNRHKNKIKNCSMPTEKERQKMI